LIRDLVLRVTELVSVGQPDVRSVATAAALHMGHSILEKTILLGSKLTISTRQFAASNNSNKTEALRNAISSLKRTRSNLDEVCVGPILQGVFVHRYRDSNPYIRSMCLTSLSRMTIQRPDLFLSDKYLKYFGWMMCDRESIVRVSALDGLLAPFRHNVDLSLMDHVIAKFLPRMAECVIDVSIEVQEKAVELLLGLLREGFLDDVEDETLWNRINFRSIDRNTSDKVRRIALYFVMEQLEAFDDGEETQKSKNAKGIKESLELRKSQRLDALASWLAHTLTDGPITIDAIQIDLANFLIHSMRNMPEHKDLVTNWSVMLRSIQEKSVATIDGATAGDRADVAKQRVLVQMLTEATKLEVREVADASFFESGFDKEMMVDECANKEKKKRNKSEGVHESLTVTLLMALPNLLTKFKTDSATLASLTSIPRNFIQTVFSLPQRKKDFTSLIKHLSEIFLSSSNENVLINTALSLEFLSLGTHARVPDAKRALQQIMESLNKRALELLIKKKSAKQKRDDDFTLSLYLLRLRVLTKRVDISKILDDKKLEELTNAVSGSLGKRLKNWKQECSTWEEKSDQYLIVARGIQEGLDFLLTTMAWVTRQALETENVIEDEDSLLQEDTRKYPEDDSYSNHIALLLRNRILMLVEACFDQYLVEDDDTEEHAEGLRIFCDNVQAAAVRTASDLRTLHPKSWNKAAHPFLRVLSLTEDWKLVGGSIRFFRSSEERLRTNKGKGEGESREVVNQLLLPLVRSLATNWESGNRREAGVALAHITGSGSTAGALISSLSKHLKRVSPVRLLEAHMACLRQSYEEWMDNEPEELESDLPSDAEVAAFEEAEQNHMEQFEALELQAARLSQTLGVGKLSDPKLLPALFGFVREGIRYAFSNSDGSNEDLVLVLGSRLSFLSVLGKYGNWIKQNKENLGMICRELDSREDELRKHPDFEEVHEDDLAALSSFRSFLGLQELNTTPSSKSSDGMEEEDDGVSALQTPHSKNVMKTRTPSRGSSMGSLRSKISTRSSLSPLLEEDNSDEVSPSTLASASTKNTKESMRSYGESASEDQSHGTYSTRNTKNVADINSDESASQAPSLATRSTHESASQAPSVATRSTHNTKDSVRSHTDESALQDHSVSTYSTRNTKTTMDSDSDESVSRAPSLGTHSTRNTKASVRSYSEDSASRARSVDTYNTRNTKGTLQSDSDESSSQAPSLATRGTHNTKGSMHSYTDESLSKAPSLASRSTRNTKGSVESYSDGSPSLTSRSTKGPTRLKSQVDDETDGSISSSSRTSYLTESVQGRRKRNQSYDEDEGSQDSSTRRKSGTKRIRSQETYEGRSQETFEGRSVESSVIGREGGTNEDEEEYKKMFAKKARK